MRIQVTYTGRNYQTAEQLPAELTMDDNCSVADALQVISERLSQDTQLPTSCLVAVSGEHLGSVGQCQDRPLKENDELMLIAPVAGG